MKKFGLLFVICFALYFTLYAQERKPVEDINYQQNQDVKTIYLDNLQHKTNYSPFGNETVKSKIGYGIYYVKADVDVSLEVSNDQDTTLMIKYELPPYFNWGNWLSIRREFKSIADLSNYDGLEFELKVEKASNAALRITINDIAKSKDIDTKGADEMWWYDCEDKILQSSTGWVTVRAPFKDFYSSWGEGTRHNNGKKDLSQIVAYESNFISKSGEYPKGSVLFKSLRTYKK